MCMEFPIWVRIPCYIVYAIFIVWILYKIYDNYLSYVFQRRKVVKVRLVSKVAEEYSELKTYMGTGNGSRTYGLKSPYPLTKSGTAYRLYFDIKGKTKELDVDKKTFDSMEDGMEGMLDYKGCMFYSFEADK